MPIFIKKCQVELPIRQLILLPDWFSYFEVNYQPFTYIPRNYWDNFTKTSVAESIISNTTKLSDSAIYIILDLTNDILLEICYKFYKFSEYYTSPRHH